jgi:hypothetical protein
MYHFDFKWGNSEKLGTLASHEREGTGEAGCYGNDIKSSSFRLNLVLDPKVLCHMDFRSLKN